MSVMISGVFATDDAFDTEQAMSVARLSKIRLAALRVQGGGAPYVVSGRRVLYPKAQFLEWVASRTSPIRRSTSDVAAR